MTEDTRTWNLTEAQWQALTGRAEINGDTLEDGAFVRAESDETTGQTELYFFATGLNKPNEWRYPLVEPIPGSATSGAFVGRVWHDAMTGFVHFEPIVYAAAQAVRADYESGVSDLDYVTYEQEVERAVRGTPADAAWLEREFARLVSLTD
jgi:hypothetical protein